MKKTIAVLLALLMLLGALSSGLAQGTEAPGEAAEEITQETTAEAAEETAGEAAEEAPVRDSLIVGTLTPMTGRFFTDMWGNNTADADVRALVHGCSTVAWTYNGDYQVDQTVVREVVVTQDTVTGDKTYAFSLFDDLRYNDGTPITAKDYAFSILLCASPIMPNLGATGTPFNHLEGYDAFQNGGSFAGVRLDANDPYALRLIIPGENLPYFYELAMVAVTPYPMSVIAPGCDVTDDGTGTRITGAFGTALLRQTLLGENGYITHPSVSSGSYMLTGYDGTAATFKANPYYKGTFDGQIPVIKNLTYKPVSNDTLIEEFQNGTVDVVNKISLAETITKGMALQQAEQAGMVNYVRTGMNFVGFACEGGITASASVRKAIALCLDSQGICDAVMTGYAMPIYGYYGIGQWMAARDLDILLEKLDIYEMDTYAAAAALEEDGWTLNEAGGAYVQADGAVRYKLIGGNLVKLELHMAAQANNAISDAVCRMLASNLSAIGGSLVVSRVTMAELLSAYYRADGTRGGFDMFHLGSNFSQIFDPYLTFNTSDAYQGVINTSGLKSEALMALALDMRNTEAGDLDGYYEKWLLFQEQFIDDLPLVPIFSNIYFDLYPTDLYEYFPNALWSWAMAINYATFVEPAEDELTEDILEIF